MLTRLLLVPNNTTYSRHFKCSQVHSFCLHHSDGNDSSLLSLVQPQPAAGLVVVR